MMRVQRFVVAILLAIAAAPGRAGNSRQGKEKTYLYSSTSMLEHTKELKVHGKVQALLGDELSFLIREF